MRYTVAAFLALITVRPTALAQPQSRMRKLALSVGALVLLSGPLMSCTKDVPYRTVRLEQAPQCRSVFRENNKLTGGDGSIDKSLIGNECWQRSLEEHPEYDLLTIEFDDQGWLQGTSGFTRKRPDHLDDLRTALGQIYDENRQDGISLVVFVHGWHHLAAPADTDVQHFRSFLGGIKAAENGRTLSETASPGTKRRAYNEQVGAGPRVVGVYVGWRGESVDLWGLRYATFWERKSTAEQVAAGSVRELFQLLDVVHDCGRQGLPWEDVIRPQSAEREPGKPDPVGRRNVQMLTIGHSFGGLITYRAMSSEFIGHAVTASKDNFIGRTGGLVVIVNPAFEGARYEPLHTAGQRIPGLKPNQLPAVIVATTKADKATRYAFPIARWFNTFFETMPDAERDAAILAVGHNERYRTHNLTSCSESDPQCKQSCQPKKSESLDAIQKATAPDRSAILGETELMDEIRKKGFQDKTTYLCSGLKLETTAAATPPQNPFWVVYTTEDIMDGHNNIFNPKFVSFFRQMYLGISLARTERSAAPRCVR